MQSTKALREKAAQLLAADAATLAPAADENKMVLLMANFAPGEALPFADLHPATFDGSTPLDCELGTQPEGLDPATSDAVITISPPVGGFRWETTGVTNLPQTIYGFALMNNAMNGYFGAELLAAPITLTGVNQVVQLPPVTMTLLAGSLR